MENTISLNQFWQVLKQNWWKIVVMVLIIVIAAAMITEYCLPRKYSSSVEFYIVNVNQSVDYTTAQVVGVDQQLAENYVQIIKSDAMISLIREKLKTDHTMNGQAIEISNAQIRSMISSSTSKTASTFSVTVTAENPTLAYQIACYIQELAPELVTDISKPGEISTTVPFSTVAASLNEKDPTRYGALAEAMQNAAEQLLKDTGSDRLLITGVQNRLECIQVIREPVENLNHVSPSTSKICLLAALVTAILCYAFFFLRDYLSTAIHTEDDIKQLTDLPILGSIPSWHMSSKKDTGNVYAYPKKGGKYQ